jgi:hypothetical protein
MSSHAPISSAAREALREKYRSNLAALEEMRSRRSSITKVRQPITSATLFNWVRDG